MPRSKFRVWVAGPRRWENEEPIDRVITKVTSKYGIGRLLLLTGGATGVDDLVEKVANEKGIHCVRVRACWPVGRQAGPTRNALIAEELEPKLLIAFHYYDLNPTNHRGTQNAMQQARERSIPVKVIRVNPSLALPSSVSDESPMGRTARERHGGRQRNKKPRRRRQTPS